jgi:hypothetical protein
MRVGGHGRLTLLTATKRKRHWDSRVAAPDRVPVKGGPGSRIKARTGDRQGHQIEANTRRVLEHKARRRIDWNRIVINED